MKQGLILLFLLSAIFFLSNCRGTKNPATRVKSDSIEKAPDYEAILQDLTGHKTYFGFEEALKEPEKVGWISLSGYELDSVPKQLLSFPNLQGLDLSNNKLNILPPWIDQLRNLREIDLRKNKISTLPAEFFNLTKLQKIDLWGNELGMVPAGIGKLTNLQELNISGNKLINLPASFELLSKLTFLMMDINEFMAIPEVLFKMKGIKRLHLYDNDISFVQSGIALMTNLEELRIDMNRLSPEEVANLLNLLPNCQISAENQNTEPLSYESKTIGSLNIADIKWIKLNDYVQYTLVRSFDSAGESNDLVSMLSLGAFQDSGKKYIAIEDDNNKLEMSYGDMGGLLLDSAFFITHQKGEYLFRMKSEIMYMHRPELLYTIQVDLDEHGVKNSAALKKELLKLEFVEKVTIDTMEITEMDFLLGNLQPAVYLQAILKNKKVTIQQSAYYASRISEIDGVEGANFNDMYTQPSTSPGGIESVSRVTFR